MDTDPQQPPMNLQQQQQQQQQQLGGNNSNNTMSHGGGLASSSSSSLGVFQNEQLVVRKAGKEAVCHFLESQNAFAVLRTSGKVVVFNTRIPIQLAFYALVEHDMLAAPLWEPVKCQFVGLLTVTDFIDLLRHYRHTGHDVTALATRSIAEIILQQQQQQQQQTENNQSSSTTQQSPDDNTTYSNNNNNNNPSNALTETNTPIKLRPFIGVPTTCTLKDACIQLLKRNVDFLPIVYTEDMRVLSCITYTTILEHLVLNFREQRRLFDDSVMDLRIGTYGDDKLAVIYPNNTLAEALELMHRHDLSALPVIDHPSTRKVVGVYSRSDITFLTKATDAEDAVRNLNLPVNEILSQARRSTNHNDVTTPDALRTCYPSHTLQSIFESFAQFRFNRLYVIDDQNNDRLIGVVSARDLVAYFLQDECDDEQQQQQNEQFDVDVDQE